MVQIVINHPSKFTAYLIAVSIYLYYQNRSRTIKIIIIESSANRLVNGINHDFKPWCGVNTLSNFHFINFDFLINHLLKFFLKDSDFNVFPLDQVQVINNATRNFNMDKPINCQQELIQVSISNSSKTVGLIYHPIHIMNRLRYLMLTTNKIVFTTLNNNSTIKQFIGSIKAIGQNEQIILLDYTKNQPSQTIRDFNYLVNSHLNKVYSINNVNRFPSHILWLPKFKALTKLSTQNRIIDKIYKIDHRLTKVDINHEKFDIIENDVLTNLDLFHALKYSDITLKVIDELVTFGNITMTSNKF